MNLKNKTFLITGATGGIGSVLARKLDQEGANLILVGRNPKKILTLKTKHLFIKADFSSLDEVKNIRDKVKNTTIDVLINMAGVGIYKPMTKLTQEDFIYSLKVNLIAPFVIIRSLIKNLTASKIGLVLNIGSGAGVIPFKNRSAYCASKFGLRGLSLSLSEEFKDKKPHFCLITLGSTMTTFGGKSLEKQREKARKGQAIFPVSYVVSKLIKIIKEGNWPNEIVLYPSEHGFGKWYKS